MKCYRPLALLGRRLMYMRSNMQNRRCPSCLAILPIGHGVKFDAEDNVICVKCDKPIIATAHAAEQSIKSQFCTPAATVRTGVSTAAYGCYAGAHQTAKKKPCPFPRQIMDEAYPGTSQYHEMVGSGQSVAGMFTD